MPCRASSDATPPDFTTTDAAQQAARIIAIVEASHAAAE
jgi:hypothetical protein